VQIMKIEQPAPQHTDDRGEIMDILAEEPIDFVTRITSKAGAVRGNHYHKDTFQWVYMLSGRIRVCAYNNGSGREEAVISTGDLLLNEPLEHHAFEALEDSVFLVLTRGPRGGEHYEDDTYRLDNPLITPVS
jgi:quercetin dioxygenase-like cupin family protein